ncbi:unnamed protein product [marine sediment metagenome]|uniref:Uncharacterized protein n=1 Tax=marine sediment metagenome TaxID=412755 RepID=X1IDV4_9ZZZZ
MKLEMPIKTEEFESLSEPRLKKRVKNLNAFLKELGSDLRAIMLHERNSDFTTFVDSGKGVESFARGKFRDIGITIDGDWLRINAYHKEMGEVLRITFCFHNKPFILRLSEGVVTDSSFKGYYSRVELFIKQKRLKELMDDTKETVDDLLNTLVTELKIPQDDISAWEIDSSLEEIKNDVKQAYDKEKSYIDIAFIYNNDK